MSRDGCPEEDQQQTKESPGVVSPDEPIVFALIKPLTTPDGSVAVFQKDKLKKKDLSVCRATHCTHNEILNHVVAPMRNKDPNRVYVGYHWATCAEIRAINAQTQKEGEAVPYGAFCVIDQALPGYAAHARMGYSNPNQEEFWKRHDREAARGNLRLVFGRRGIFQNHQTPPFKSE